MIVPSSNTCLEPVTWQLAAAAGGDVTVHVTRLRVTNIALDEASLAQFAEEPMRQAAALLADAHPGAIAWNGTSGSWLGIGRDEQLTAAITGATGVPATTSTLALMAAFEAFGARHIALLTPYTPDVGARIADCYGHQGLSVTAAEHLGISDNQAFAAVPAGRLAEAVRGLARARPEAVAIVCTNVRGAGLAAGLEDELGLPVFDSVTATFWHALDRAGAARAIGGWGTLLGSGALRARAQSLCADLLAATSCDRTTLRLDLPAIGLHVDLVTAEVTGPGVRSIRFDASLDQRRLPTVAWLEQTRRNLIQPDFAGDPQPPAALVDVYGVRAQMLGPVLACGHVAGWFSAHSLRERPWSGSDQGALDEACKRAGELVAGVLARPAGGAANS
jgi:maleate isomerase